MTQPPLRPFTVIVPAHNEEAIIGRSLAAMTQDMVPGAMEIIVVCNGCEDGTAGAVQASAPEAILIELPEGSKPRALNAGNARARHVPRLYADADVLISFPALSALAEALRAPGAMMVAPSVRHDTRQCSALVRRFIRASECLPYMAQDVGGSGLFGLSADAIARVGHIPEIIADDEYVRTRFSPAERQRIVCDDQGQAVIVTVVPPADLASLIRIESRQRAGLAQVRTSFPTDETAQRANGWGAFAAACRDGCTPLDLAVYILVKLAGRLHYRLARLRGEDLRWLRDEAARQTI